MTEFYENNSFGYCTYGIQSSIILLRNFVLCFIQILCFIISWLFFFFFRVEYVLYTDQILISISRVNNMLKISHPTSTFLCFPRPLLVIRLWHFGWWMQRCIPIWVFSHLLLQLLIEEYSFIKWFGSLLMHLEERDILTSWVSDFGFHHQFSPVEFIVKCLVL